MIDGKSKHMKTAKSLGVECVTEDFLNEIEPDGVFLMIKKKNIAPWEGTVSCSFLYTLRSLSSN